MRKVMIDSKDLSSLVERNIAMPDFSGLARISESLTAMQTSELQKAINIIIESQKKILEDTSYISSLNKFTESLNAALMPTKSLVSELIKAMDFSNIDIALSQQINSITLTLKSINSVIDIGTGLVKDSSEIDTLKSGSSCLVSMSADAKERYDAGSIVYENSASVQIVAEITEIKESQKRILNELAGYKKNTVNRSVPAKLTDIGFVNGGHSTISFNGNEIQFKGGIASVILYVIFGRKNFSKTRSYEPMDFFDKCEGNDWLCISEEERKKFRSKVYQSVRNINNRFMEATCLGEKIIIQNGNNSYTLNQKLFK